MSQAIHLLQHARYIRPMNSLETIARSRWTQGKLLHGPPTGTSTRFGFQQQHFQSTVALVKSTSRFCKPLQSQLQQTRKQTLRISNTAKRYKSIPSSRRRSSRNKSTATYSGMPSASTAQASSVSASSISYASINEKIHRILLRPRRIPIPRWITPQQKTFNYSECFGHASFVLVAASYATDDFLYLRIAAVAGSSAMLVFTYFHPHGRVLWLPFQWNVLFIGINAYRIGKSLYYKHIGMNLGEEMTKIKKAYFDAMDITDYAKLVEIATEETFSKGDLVCYQGQKVPFVRLVIQGEMDAMRDGIKTYSLIEGNFVTEAGLHAGILLDGTIEASCTIVASDEKPTKCLRWNRTELVELLKTESGMRRAFKAVLSWDIIRKLKGQRTAITDHKIADAKLWTIKRKEQTEDRYAAIVQNVLTSRRDLEDMKKRTIELDHYRTIHHIDDDHHKLALKRIGWTLHEYNAGMKEKMGSADRDTRNHE